jgi:hypothetical protein
MNKTEFKKMLSSLGLILKCPVCQHKYGQNMVKVVESHMDEAVDEAMLVVHIDCSKCKSSVVFNFEIFGPEVFSAVMVTDLTADDMKYFNPKESISSNDVLDFHTSFKSFKGDFKKLFAVK